MAKVLQCPWFASNGFSKWCMNGHFPCNCETCNCEDKKYVEIYTTTSTTCIKENKL